MSEFTILQELIQDSVQIPIQMDQNQKRFIYLEEKQDNYGVTIRGISDQTDIFVIDADRFPAPKVFFRDSKGAQCLAAYIKQVGKVFWGNPDFLADYQYRFVSLKHLSTNKKPKRSSQTYPLHSSPEKCLCLSPGKFLQLRELIEILKN